MNIDKLKLKKTGVLYFDMLNGYFHGMDKAAKARKKPMVDNAALSAGGQGWAVALVDRRDS